MTRADAGARGVLTGPLGFEVARFGTPLALGMGLQTTFNLVDAYIIARLGHDVVGPSLGAIGICDQVAALGTILSYGISIATGAIVSRKRGEGDAEGVRRAAWQSLLAVIALGVAFAILALFGSRVLLRDVVGAKGEVVELGWRYLRVSVGGSFSIFLLLHLMTLQRALGSSNTPITMLVGANVANLVLAVLLVYGPGPAPPVFGWGPPIAEALGLPRMELLGAAWATVLSRTLVLAPTLWIVVRRFGLFGPGARGRPDVRMLASIWGIAWPTSCQLALRITAMLLTHSLVARAYTTATDQSMTTALGIVFRLETMALFVGLGWGSAAQTFMGLNLGAGNRHRARQSGWYAMLYDAVMVGGLAIAYVWWGARIVGFFDSDASVLGPALAYIGWVAPSYVALGIGIVLGSAIQGAGATKLTLVLDALVVFAVQLPASMLVVFGFGHDAERLWQVVALTNTAFAGAYLIAYRRGRYLETVIR